MSQEAEKRPFFTLAVSTPEEERWYVVSIYQRVVKGLINRRRSATDEEVRAFLVELKQREYAWLNFTHTALKARAKEFNQLFSECQKEVRDPKEAEKLTKRLLKEKYREIDKDPSQNHSFLDEILLGAKRQ